MTPKENCLIRWWRGGYLNSVLAGQDDIDSLVLPPQGIPGVGTGLGVAANSLDTFVDGFFKLDIRAEYRFRNFLTIFFEGTNLTNEPLRKFFGDQSRLHTIQFTKPIFFIGFKLNR